MKFYERKEIKDVMAYLKLVDNPSDGLSLKRIINVPSRGVGEKTIEKIEAFSREKGLSLSEGLKQAIGEDWLTPAVKAKIKEFIQWIEEFRKDVESFTLSQLTLALLAKTEYLQRLKEEGTDEAFSKMENIDELINVMMGLERGEEKVSLESFLDKVSLVTDVDLYEDKGNRVSLMTLHCAKGLEFPAVFIVGIEEGLLPHYRRGEEIEDMEEERRLFYVGMTRAKERLFLSRAEQRSTFGAGRANLPSRFLDELPSELLEFQEKKGRIDNLFSQAAPWREEDHRMERVADDVSQEIFFPEGGGVVLTPEGFFPLKIGMRVRHSKFGEGRVKSVEGMDENQKATIMFGTVGSKRLKVCSAHLDILE
jgi:DNA helicase-2/ATP-dependent DNA helicase PcrA